MTIMVESGAHQTINMENAFWRVFRQAWTVRVYDDEDKEVRKETLLIWSRIDADGRVRPLNKRWASRVRVAAIAKYMDQKFRTELVSALSKEKI